MKPSDAWLMCMKKRCESCTALKVPPHVSVCLRFGAVESDDIYVVPLADVLKKTGANAYAAMSEKDSVIINLLHTQFTWIFSLQSGCELRNCVWYHLIHAFSLFHLVFTVHS